ncbi:MmcQ/YjbR family DNA-binding protein [Dinghuibacter silviterrae]|uniref:Putative DNA-binding protein (MmcQ/YjbR family) n=1 Tax=Dinghuibacter silviterrae TaxID=1539049 RepID=A0A4R8DHP5_9BACT|nr:MmcQ/YjbR family DNA-binding protein [Dinghuibacter silviterrae]TDW97249.1 putative DNA-binding protein (MmcQ/YjbR family) [Dinghuibacter silviterrae]
MTADDLRALTADLPKVTEDIKWEDNLTFLVGDKIFAIAGLAGNRVGFKVSEEDFAELTGRDDIIQAPHFARGQWVQVNRPGALSRQEWKDYLKKSYTLVLEKLPKKTRKELGI